MERIQELGTRKNKKIGLGPQKMEEVDESRRNNAKSDAVKEHRITQEEKRIQNLLL